MDEQSLNDIMGKRVVTPDGREIGHLEEIRFTPESWAVTGLIVALEDKVAKDLDMKAPFLGRTEIELSPQRVHGIGDFVTLNVSLPELRDLVASAQVTEAETDQGP